MNVLVGHKVKVLFAHKEIFGIVINIKNSSEVEDVNEIIEVVNYEIRLNEELIKLGKYLSEVTFCTLIKAYQTMLPSSLKVKKIDSNYEKYDEYLVLNRSEEEIDKYIENNKRCKSQIDILNRLLTNIFLTILFFLNDLNKQIFNLVTRG